MDKKNLNLIISLRHDLHAHPELSMQEVRTKQRICSFLQEHTSMKVVDRGSWVYAVKRGSSDTAGSIAFRADMDALPMGEMPGTLLAGDAPGDMTLGKMSENLLTESPLELSYASVHPGVAHKCGHDGHVAALCGLALELETRNTDRTVYLIFQPGEETGSGALQCKELIRETGISGIYAFHNRSGFPEGMMLYRPGVTQPASEGIRICLTGKTSHAAEPEQGRNPAHTIAAVALYAESFVKEAAAVRYRETAEKDVEKAMLHKQNALLLCTITGMRVGNGDFGISPGDGEICFTLRSDQEEQLKNLERELLAYAKAEAEKEGLHMQYFLQDYFPETRNDPECLKNVIQAASMAGLPARELEELWRPSEDFGYYLKECPGAMFYIGNGMDYPAVHTGTYDFNDRILEPAVDLFLALADTCCKN